MQRLKNDAISLLNQRDRQVSLHSCLTLGAIYFVFGRRSSFESGCGARQSDGVLVMIGLRALTCDRWLGSKRSARSSRMESSSCRGRWPRW